MILSNPLTGAAFEQLIKALDAEVQEQTELMRLACIHHTFFCHRELAESGRGDPARWVASSLRFSQ